MGKGLPVLEVRNLVKRFGPSEVVRDLDLVLEAGDVFGFIGPNGAGKTTTIRILATVLKRSSGTVRIAGHSVDDVEAVRPLIGFMPDSFGVYEDITVEDYLYFFARVYNIEAMQQPFAVNETLALAGIESLREKAVDSLSRGQKQRLGLARTQLHRPRLMLLDEPASGLDPEARVEFRDIIHHLRQQGMSVLISSHVLSDLSDMCNKVGVIHQGVMRWCGPTHELLDRSDRALRVRLRVLENADAARSILLETPGVSDVVWKERDIVFSMSADERERAALLQKLMAAEICVVNFTGEKPTLEEVYLDLIASEKN